VRREINKEWGGWEGSKMGKSRLEGVFTSGALVSGIHSGSLDRKKTRALERVLYWGKYSDYQGNEIHNVGGRGIGYYTRKTVSRSPDQSLLETKGLGEHRKGNREKHTN